MQVMPKTSRYLGTNPARLHNPEINIGVGCLYNSKLLNQWKKDVDVDEHRLAFTLASYNAGRGRVLKSFRKSDSLATWILVHPDLPLETQNYVHRIVLKHNLYSMHVLP
jgi:soluble lytic murein transglycosylase-like protein